MFTEIFHSTKLQRHSFFSFFFNVFALGSQWLWTVHVWPYFSTISSILQGCSFYPTWALSPQWEILLTLIRLECSTIDHNLPLPVEDSWFSLGSENTHKFIMALYHHHCNGHPLILLNMSLAFTSLGRRKVMKIW